MTSDRSPAATEASLRRRFRVVETPVEIGARTIGILHPESAEDLINERDFDRDERLPYWAELWPSSRVLAAHLLELEGGGRRLLELGCGTGLVATSASLAGFDVVASDYYEDALRFTRVNAQRNGAATPRGLLLDWRKLPPDLPRFDVVVASDVLYERAYGEIVARALAATLAEGGTALVADPGRVAREDFVNALEPLGLSVVKRVPQPFVEGVVRQTITRFEIASAPVRGRR